MTPRRTRLLRVYRSDRSSKKGDRFIFSSCTPIPPDLGKKRAGRSIQTFGFSTIFYETNHLYNNLDDERQHDIYAYFREEAESDSLEDAIKELGNEFEEEEIRLMRIKFLSEMGN